MGKHGGGTFLKMKVTVCFGTVRVIVPCPSEDMLVRDLIHQATLRYKKATGKGQGSWVVVHKLKSQSDGGILDPDDKLVDVADDREQIMAIYEEENDGMPSLQHNAGDGTSASSVGTNSRTNSPDIFQGNDHKFQPFARTDIEITGEELSGPASGSPSSSLQVRRGSEPNLTKLTPVQLSAADPDPSKRWSAAPIIDGIADEDNEELNKRNFIIESSPAIQNTSSGHRSNKRVGQTLGDDEDGCVSSVSRINNSGSRPISVITNTSVISNSNSMAVRSSNYTPVNNHGVNNTFAISSHQSISSTSAKPIQYQQQLHQINQNSSNFVQLTDEPISRNDGHFNVNSLPRSASTGSTAVFVSNNNNNNNASNIHQLHGSQGSKSNSHLVSSSQQGLESSAHGSRFTRDQGRLSIQQTEARWADAADRALWLSLRKEPLGANASPETPTDSIPSPNAYSTPVIYKNNPSNNNNNSAESPFPVYHRDHSSHITHHNGPVESTKDGHSVLNQMFHHGNINNKLVAMTSEEIVLVLRYEPGPLGIHVVPEHLAHAKNQGLIVQGVEAGGRIDRDGRLESGDKIIEINGHSLIGVPFQRCQELFREGLNTTELHLKVIKRFNRDEIKGCLRDQNLNTHTEGDVVQSVSVQNLVQKFNGSEQVVEEKENMVHSHEKIVGDAKVATVSPTKKLLQAVPLTRPSTTTTLINSNTRKIGRKYEIDLQKGPQGLGFSITTRDNPAGGNCPIYIKNILPTGAAIDDGRLRPGDRLLEVNGTEITGRSQAEAVSILRNVPQGGFAKLIVSRQERVDLSPKLPRQIPPEKVTDDVQPVPWTEREILALDIPVLDTEKAGLGISVKGKTTAAQRGNMIDMGIYIKSVIHGGAASRDTRLRPNDQLLSINGVSLLDRSNTDAMETLRKTMTQDGPKPKPGFITLSIARRVPSSSAPTTDSFESGKSGCGSSASGDEMDSWGGCNSISVDGNRSSGYSKTPNMNQIESVQSNNTAIFLSAYSHSQNQNQFAPQNYSNQQQQQEHHNLRSSFRTPQKNEEGVKESSLSPAIAIGKMSVDLPRNPVLDRLAGKSNNPAMRNESYYRATNETWNATMAQSRGQPSDGVKSIRNQPVTVQNMRGEMVIIDDDYSAPEKPPRRSRSSTPDNHLSSSSTNRKPAEMSSHEQSHVDIREPSAGPFSDATYASQTSLEDSGGFFRDAFGRQSMSEKRHATLDAKNTDTYQRNKKLREERERQKHEHETDQDPIYSSKHGEALARERNLQDEMARRRGTKRPFCSSTEDGLTQPGTSHGHGDGELTNFDHESGGGECLYRPQIQSPNGEKQHSRYPDDNARPTSPASVKTRKSFGDQLIELLFHHHWGPRNPTHRSPENGGGLQRVNSADSLVDPVQHQPHGDMSGSNIRSVSGSYQRNAKMREGELQVPLGPSLGMKKSSSLESLQTMVQEIQIQEDVKSGYGRAGPATVRVVRGRGCNESFRQAVDRSYETVRDGEPWFSPHSQTDQRKKIHQKRLQETLAGENSLQTLRDLDPASQMETLAEEETESCISRTTYGTQRLPYSEPSESDFDGIYGKSKGAKKKAGLFRGLGSMFRFGRHRKSTGGGGGLSAAEIRRQQQAEVERQEQQRESSAEEMKKEKTRQAVYSEQMRRMVEKQKMEKTMDGNNPSGITVSIASTNNAATSNYNYVNERGNVNTGNTGSNLRPHQFRKSMENQAIRERERERERDVNGNQWGQSSFQIVNKNPNHLRSASYDVYNEMTRPGSRVGFVDPKKYSHYLNEEIRHHLKKSTGGGGGLSAAEIRRQQQAEVERQEQQRESSAEEMKKEKTRQAVYSEQMRRMVEKQKMEKTMDGNNPSGITVSIASTNNAATSNYNYVNERGNVNTGNTGSNLRPHQFRKSMENQAIRERERERERDVNGNQWGQSSFQIVNKNPNHLRSASYDVYNEMTRPGSRVGFVDPKKYSHYLNEEIRHHLNDETPNGNLKMSEEQLRQMRTTVVEQRKKAILESRRHQQHYHSQRRENPRSRQERPVSNFYEYESVQAAMHTQQGPPSTNSQHIHGITQQHNNQIQGNNNNHQQQQQQQPLYVMNGYGNNNGITLPSPTTLPISFQHHHQRSASQFQAQTISGHSRLPYQTSGSEVNSTTLQHQQSQAKFFQQQQQPKPNSLPRVVHHKQDMMMGQHQHRHPPPTIHQQMSDSYNKSLQSQNSIASLQGYRVPQNPRIPSSQHSHNHTNGVLHRNLHQNNNTLGSKV